jgi:hypothetical protein
MDLKFILGQKMKMKMKMKMKIKRAKKTYLNEIINPF